MLLYVGFDWTVNRIYVPEGQSLLLRYKGPLFFTWGNQVRRRRPFRQGGRNRREGDDARPGTPFLLPDLVGAARWSTTWWCSRANWPSSPASWATICPAGSSSSTATWARPSSKGILRRTFGPGRYRINPYGYEVSIVKTEQIDVGNGQIKYSGWIHINPGYVGVVTYLTDNPALAEGRHPERHAAAGPVSDQPPRNADRHGLHRLQ